MRVILTPDDLKKGELVDVGWHPAEIVRYDEGAASDDAKNPGSTNCNFYFKILDGPGKGVEVRRLFNETALGFGKALYATLGFPKTPDGNYELSSELFNRTVGSKLMIYIKRGKNNKTGSEFNDVQDFKPMN